MADVEPPSTPPSHDPVDEEAAAGPRWRVDRSAILVLAVVLAVLSAALVGVAITTTPSADEQELEDIIDPGLQGCDRGNWPRHLFGKPQGLTGNPAAGVYLWLDFEGWHLRAAGSVAVDGTVHAFGPPVTPGTVTGGGGVEVLPTSLTFDLDGTDPSTGLDFTVGCDYFALTFDVRDAGGQLAADQIRIGPQGIAEANPITFQREAQQ